MQINATITADKVKQVSNTDNTFGTSNADDISFLTDSTISDAVYFQKLQGLERRLTEIYLKDQADNKDLMLLNKVYAMFNKNAPSVMGMIKSRTSGILKGPVALQKGHEDLTCVSMFLDTTEKLLKYHGIIMDINAFREKASDQFRDHIRDSYYLKSFGLRNDTAGIESYYQLGKDKISDYFKVLPGDRKLKELFWFSYSRIHLRDTLETSNIGTVLKRRTGDCTDFTALNAYLLRESGFMCDLPVIELSPDNTHSFVTTYEIDADALERSIERNEDASVRRVILDYNRMYYFNLKITDIENISAHMMFDVKKIEGYLFYTPLIEQGILRGRNP